MSLYFEIFIMHIEMKTRPRTIQDDINSVKKKCLIERSGSTNTVPVQSGAPIVMWKNQETNKTIDIDDTEDEVISKCMKWPMSSDARCHHCAHQFDGIPVPVPIAYDIKRNIYHCKGIFCSWQCSKSYNIREMSPVNRGNRNMYIALLAYRTWVKLKRPKKTFDELYKARSYFENNIDMAPHKSTLIEFGGELTIEQYRKGFYSITPPEESMRGSKPYLSIRQKMCLPFVDISDLKFTSVETGEVSKNYGRKEMIQMTTNRTHEFSNSFCNRLTKAKEDSSIMKRKREKDTKNTLMSSMGIVIKKKK